MLALAWLFATGCSRHTDPSPASQAPDTPPMSAPSASTTAVMAFLAAPDGACAWTRIDLPDGTRTPLVAFPRGCPRTVHLAVSRANDVALVQFDDTALYELALANGFPSGSATALPLPPAGVLDGVGFSVAGAPVALTLGGGTKDGGDLVFGEQRFATKDVTDGLPDLAHAWTWSEGAWQHTEIALCSTGWDFATGTGALDTARHLTGARSTTFWGRWAGSGAMSPAASDVARALTAAVPPADAEGEWHVATVGDRRLAVWNESIEFLVPWGPVAVDVHGTWTPVPQPPREAGLGLAVQERDGDVLIVDARGDAPLVFRIDTGASVWLHPGAVGATFWPPPGAELP